MASAVAEDETATTVTARITLAAQFARHITQTAARLVAKSAGSEQDGQGENE